MSISNQKGDVGEAAFALAAAKRGYWTAKMPQDCPYDFVLDKKDGTILRVQVKYRSVSKTGTVMIKMVQHKEHCKANRQTYTSENIDALAVYVADSDIVFLIPVADIGTIDEVTFRCNPSKNNQTHNVRMITQYAIW